MFSKSIVARLGAVSRDRVFAAVFGLAISMAIASQAQAVMITWSGSPLSTGDPITIKDGTADISTTGSLVEAHNTGSGAAAITAGGVLFDAAETNFFSGGGNASAFNPKFVTGDADFDEILRTGSFFNGGALQTYTIDGLMSGNSYLVQFFVVDSRSSATSSSSGNSLTISDDMSGTLTSGAYFNGYAFTGTFVAMGTTQDVGFTGVQCGTCSNPFSLMNAWQLRDTTDIASVPEPATLALVAFGGLALLRRRS